MILAKSLVEGEMKWMRARLRLRSNDGVLSFTPRSPSLRLRSSRQAKPMGRLGSEVTQYRNVIRYRPITHRRESSSNVESSEAKTRLDTKARTKQKRLRIDVCPTIKKPTSSWIFARSSLSAPYFLYNLSM